MDSLQTQKINTTRLAEDLTLAKGLKHTTRYQTMELYIKNVETHQLLRRDCKAVFY
jgi:hypothetical protein